MQVRVPPDPPAKQWREWFVDLCLETRAVVMRHPQAAGLVFTYFPNTVIMPSHERSARLLAAAGVPSADCWVVVKAMEKLVFGMIFGEAQDLANGRASVPRGVQRETYPLLSAAIDSSPAGGAALLERGVRILLAGVGTPGEAAPARRKR